MPLPSVANIALAARFIQARPSAGLETIHAAAIRLAMYPQTYALHEQGRVGVRSNDLRRYAEAFGVSH